jgi:hypothetical protein
MNFNCKILRSGRKSLSIEIERNGSIVIRAPFLLSDRKIDKFLNEKKKWITRKVAEMEKQNHKKNDFIKSINPENVHLYKKKARELLNGRTCYYAQKYNFKYRKIRLSSARGRWGSCSASNNLNFNWKIIFAPIEVLNYLVVHELVHTKHKNHQKRFWKTVEQICPNFKTSRKWLKENSFLLEV